MSTWKVINTNPNYEISNEGNIRLIKTKKNRKFKVDKDGYLRINLYNKNTKKYDWYYVHRLVLTYFDRAPLEGEEAHHKDANRQNNNIENLMWTSRKENDSYVVHIPPNKIKVCQYDLQGKLLATYESMSEAARISGCHLSKISDVCNNKRYTTGGYKWKKIESSTTN